MHLFEVIHEKNGEGRFATTEQGHELDPTRPTLRKHDTVNAKGAVTQLAAMEGYLVMAVGPKVIMFFFTDEKKLQPCGFYDVHIYVNSMEVVKNYILIGDVYTSVMLLRWVEESRQLVLLSRYVVGVASLLFVFSFFLLRQSFLVVVPASVLFA